MAHFINLNFYRKIYKLPEFNAKIKTNVSFSPLIFQIIEIKKKCFLCCRKMKICHLKFIYSNYFIAEYVQSFCFPIYYIIFFILNILIRYLSHCCINIVYCINKTFY